MEHYGDIHLHQADYPGCAAPGACAGDEHNYYHGNDAKPDHPYDCNCNLCQAPYSLPYESGAGGHLGAIQRACTNPNCTCPNCDGNCKCGANKMTMLETVMQYFNLKYIVIGTLLGLLVFYLAKRRYFK